jgi:hypothetical protein
MSSEVYSHGKGHVDDGFFSMVCRFLEEDVFCFLVVVCWIHVCGGGVSVGVSIGIMGISDIGIMGIMGICIRVDASIGIGID